MNINRAIKKYNRKVERRIMEIHKPKAIRNYVSIMRGIK